MGLLAKISQITKMNLNFVRNIFDHQTKSINSAVFILAITSFASALLGLFRDRLLASNFGAGNELDIYYAAFRIPDFISMVFIIGAISAAIIPVFSQYLVNSREKAFQFLSNLLNLFLISLIGICLIFIIFTPQIITIIVPGFLSEKKEITVLLTRIMFLSPILLGISNVISAILQVFKRFFVASLAPIMYNLGIIFGILFFVPWWGLTGLAWGVVFGGFLHLIIQLPSLWKVGFKLEKIFNFKETGLWKVIKLTLPRSIGLATTQINLIIITAIASTLTAGSIAVFSLAETLSRPLYTFVAVSFSTAVFPALSLSFSKKAKEEFNQIFSSAFNKIFWLVLPVGILLFIFKDFIVKIILQNGKFGYADAGLTAACFGIFSLGIFAEGLTLHIAKSFYSFHDTKTPALISIGNAIFTLILCLVFVKLLSSPNLLQHIFINFLGIKNPQGAQVIALPLAISLSAIFHFLTLWLLFRRKRKLVFNTSLAGK